MITFLNSFQVTAVEMILVFNHNVSSFLATNFCVVYNKNNYEYFLQIALQNDKKVGKMPFAPNTI